MNYKKTTLLPIFIIFFIIFPQFSNNIVLAQTAPEVKLLQSTVVGKPSIDLANYIQKMFTVIISVAISLAVIMIVIAGIEYIGSSLPGAKEDAKNRIIASLFGLLIALAAVLIVETILGGTGSINLSGRLSGLTAIETNPNDIELFDENGNSNSSTNVVPTGGASTNTSPQPIGAAVDGPTGCGNLDTLKGFESIGGEYSGRGDRYSLGNLCLINNNPVAGYCFEKNNGELTTKPCQSSYETLDQGYYYFELSINNVKQPLVNTDSSGKKFTNKTSCIDSFIEKRGEIPEATVVTACTYRPGSAIQTCGCGQKK